jgi:hypothetical protein
LRPVWEASGALFPCIYLTDSRAPTFPTIPAAARRSRVNATVHIGVAAAKMVARTGAQTLLVFPFAWECYSNGSALLTSTDLAIELLSPYNAGASGIVVWGFTGDSSRTHGPTYYDYIRTSTGPLVARFQKHVSECAEQHCSGHGRCTAVAESGDFVVPSPCECFDGYSGPACGTIHHIFGKSGAFY